MNGRRETEAEGERETEAEVEVEVAVCDSYHSTEYAVLLGKAND